MHFHYSNHISDFIAICEAGKIRSCTIIDDKDLCDRVAPFVEFPVLRKYGMERRGFIEYGSNNPRVVYQFDNEQANPGDMPYYMDILKAGIARQRRVSLFNDPVGWTEEYVWRRRFPVLQLAFESGFGIASTHLYGDVTKGDNHYCPMLDPNSPGTFKFFEGRIFWLYALAPANCRPPFVATESGAGGFQLNATEDQWVSENVRFNTYVQDYEWFEAFNKWTMTRLGLGFDRDLIDPYTRRL